MPPPSRIIANILLLARSGELWDHVLATLLRVYAGFALGVAAGTLMGALTGASDTARRLLDPSLQSLRAVPSLAWVPLFILWLGIFEASKIALIAVGVFFPIYLGVSGAIEGIDRKLIEVGRVFRLSPAAMVRRVMLPAVLPSWVISVRSGLGQGFMFVVAAEFMGASEGLGFLLVDGQQLGKPDQILAAIIVFALAGKASDAILVASIARCCAGRTPRGAGSDVHHRAPLQDLFRRHARPGRREPRRRGRRDPGRRRRFGLRQDHAAAACGRA